MPSTTSHIQAPVMQVSIMQVSIMLRKPTRPSTPATRDSQRRPTMLVAALLAAALCGNARADEDLQQIDGPSGVAASQSTGSQTRSGHEIPVGKEFQACLAKVDAAQLELQNGRPEAFKALWSHADDVTLSGGFGGKIEKGWDQIGRRLDWVGTQFSKGTNTIERIVANTNGDLGYVVQIEHIRFRVPGQAKESTRTYRVTMLFRRESEGWRIIHRQADSQMTKQVPQ